MGFLGKYLGRFLYAAFWVITGWWILNQAETYSKDLSGRYSAFHTFIQTTYNTTLPDFLNPSHLVANQVFVTQMLAYFQIAFGGLSAIGIDGCPLILSLYLTFITFLWHNPLQHSTMQDVYAHCGPWVLNMGLIGAGLLICCDARAPKPTTSKKNRKNKQTGKCLAEEPANKQTGKSVSVEKRQKKDRSKKSERD